MVVKVSLKRVFYIAELYMFRKEELPELHTRHTVKQWYVIRVNVVQVVYYNKK